MSTMPDTRAVPPSIGSIMTRPVHSVPPECSLSAATCLFTAHDIRHVLVADPGGRLIGVLSAADTLRAVADGADPREKSIAAIMKRDPICVREETSLRDAIDLLIFNRIHCLPVVDAGSRIQGVVTTTNLLSVLYDVVGGAAVTP